MPKCLHIGYSLNCQFISCLIRLYFLTIGLLSKTSPIPSALELAFFKLSVNAQVMHSHEYLCLMPFHWQLTNIDKKSCWNVNTAHCQYVTNTSPVAYIQMTWLSPWRHTSESVLTHMCSTVTHPVPSVVTVIWSWQVTDWLLEVRLQPSFSHL